MGKLLSLLARDDSNCCSPQKYDVFLDFESEWIVKIIVTESEHDKILVLTTVLNLNLNISYHLFSFRGSLKDYKIHMDMEIVTFV